MAKIGEVLVYCLGAVIGLLLGVAGFLRLYLPLKAGLGLGSPSSLGLSGEGPIVPMRNFFPVYTAAGGLIDLIVLLAFIIAGICLVSGILKGLRKQA